MAIASKKKTARKPARKARPQPPRSAAKGAAAAARPEAIEAPERSAPQTAEVDADVLEFIEAIDRFKKQNGRPFPSWSEVLMVLRGLGYSRD